ncbi:glycosyltransferase family 2 protein [Bacillus cereus ATCC 10876]|uniref:glycosyltransferase family 2 protein n=1 Tax=Bacillus TaxID=1386 RepID=UPI00019FF6AE|nr:MULTISPECIES: glycosyltransferase family 2 protein [Bacillus]MDJ0280838.1 glycosyltransferase family 2 protein [Bacillus bombysepticus]EEK47815.1 Glycosyltransferase [Bacillus cereus ATCC 10876]EMA7400079.1 glycosyltransferase family 2 protein [Bacillus cereus]KFL79257.1 glycosyl transferase 2 family protein [Bacillus cereus ATCC 10876]MBG9865550.1 glycosyl transferase [Bacillus cereus]
MVRKLGNEYLVNVIVPTLGNRIEYIKRLFNSLEEQTINNIKVIIVSQENHDRISSLLMKYKFNYHHVILSKKGLSHARNKGLEYVDNGIVTFSDDDCWYPKNAFETVVEGFKYRDIDALSFQIFDPEIQQYYKEYPQAPIEKLGIRGVLKISSIEFFINLNKIDIGDLKFDERFGLGAKYPSGEENILLADLLKQKYSIAYVNQIIVFHKKKTSENKLIDSNTFTGKGPLFKRMRGTIPAICMLIIFFVKKFHLTEKPIRSFIKSFKELLKF